MLRELKISWAAGAKSGRLFLAWLVIFLFLDICTTVLGLSLGLREMNPLLASMMRRIGLNALLVSKVAAVALAVYFLYSGRLLLLRRVTVLMGLVVGWNMLWLLAR